MKKILILTTGSFVFGTEKVTLQLINGLKSKYLFHCLVNGWNDGKFISELNELKINYTIHKLGWYYRTKIFWSLDSLIHLPFAVYQFLKLRINFDLLYTTSFRNIILLYPWINKKVIYHVHELNEHSKINRICIKIIDRKVSIYIAVSEVIKHDLIKIGISSTKIKVIYNGVNNQLETKQKRIQTKINIGIVGQINWFKGHKILLAAFYRLYLIHPNIRLLIYGDGPQEFRKELEDFAIKNHFIHALEFCGYKNDLAEIYSDIDVLCVPSIRPESFGLVACEAGLFGVPVVSSKIGGLVEIVKDGFTGYLISPSNIDELVDKLKRLIEDKSLRFEMGENAEKHIKKNFSEQMFIDNCEATINLRV